METQKTEKEDVTEISEAILEWNIRFHYGQLENRGIHKGIQNHRQKKTLTNAVWSSREDLEKAHIHREK